MTTIIKARLRGEDTLVWPPFDQGYGPTWMPNYCDAQDELTGPLGQQLLHGYQTREEVNIQGRRFWVESVEMEVLSE